MTASTPSKHHREDRLNTGMVYLVGAGPGDPELITVRGLRCLHRADVLVYDRLVHADLIDEAPATAERIFVGKAAGLHVMPQDGIQSLLVDRAQRGLVVVRLKGGDPFVFGRGAEEATTLTQAGIPWEVVPAVSSSIGVPARAGIPVTHRGVAASFAVVTAQGALPGGVEATPDWSALARIDTLVVLMGVAVLPLVAKALRAHGRAAHTPVAVIERGTLADQRVLIGTLASIADDAAAASVRAPATIVIGPVVDLRSTLASTPWSPWPVSGVNEPAQMGASTPERSQPHA